VLILNGVDEVRAHVGKELGVSDWWQITQQQTDLFGQVTGDNAPIHVDPQMAAETPFGGTIAHGYHTLALGAGFSQTMFAVRGFDVVVNYGLNRVRFPAPVRVGARVRMTAMLDSVSELPGGIQIVTGEVFEAEGVEKPVCVAEVVRRMYSN
jgi:acyl dehydratase